MGESNNKKLRVDKRQGLMERSVKLNTDLITPQMLELLRQGDLSVYERVYLKYSHKITEFICRMVKSFEDAEEISQEVFTYLWVNRGKIDTDKDKDISSYLFLLSRFYILNYFRSKRIHEAYLKEAEYLKAGQADTVEDVLHADEIKLLIELTVNKMPPQRQKIYTMSRVQNISNDDIAAQLGISKNTVEKHLTFALKDIREILLMFVLVSGTGAAGNSGWFM